MKNRGLEVYKDLKKSNIVRFRHPYTFNFYFDYGPKVDCIGPIYKSMEAKEGALFLNFNSGILGISFLLLFREKGEGCPLYLLIFQ